MAKMRNIVLLTFLAAIAAMLLQEGEAGGVTFEYTDMANWPTLFPDYCGKDRQSPININPYETKFGFFWPMQFENYHVSPEEQTVVNNGHSVSITVKLGENIPAIHDGGLPGKYLFHSYHFHWGSDGTKGSEHTVNGVRYPLELHLVHIKEEYYPDLGEGAKNGDGLAVLGIFFKISRVDNPALAPLVKTLNDIKASGSTMTKTDMYSLGTLLPKKLGKFYRYLGSLTTPSCNEAVVWTIFRDYVEISETQLSAFRDLKDSHANAIVDNYRTAQPRNSRLVQRSFFWAL
uniref:Carbonic anhydrase n=1 Tax=Hirondellea gigas TaxID=1518452 RepID=A0A2P2HXR5_9CRUS